MCGGLLGAIAIERFDSTSWLFEVLIGSVVMFLGTVISAMVLHRFAGRTLRGQTGDRDDQ